MREFEREPDIAINGHRLNEAQAMTMRVAVEMFAIDVAADLNALSPLYRARLNEIREMIFWTPPARTSEKGGSR